MKTPILQSPLLIALVSLAIVPALHAVTPPPDGGYPNQNTAVGDDALFSLTTGDSNTAIGLDALYFTTTGYSNTAVGVRALQSNTRGGGNTSVGVVSLFHNTSGMDNTAVGYGALSENTTGSDNTAVGRFTLNSNTTGLFNVALGSIAMLDNKNGSRNIAVGNDALLVNNSGNNNVALGDSALNNSEGSNNVAIGSGAGIGLRSGNNNVEIANPGVPGDSGVIRLGTEGTQTSIYVAGIMTSPSAEGVPVRINSNGQLGVRTSSARFKEHIRPMAKESEAILALKPVSFRYRKAVDSQGKAQFGLVAEEVEKVDPDLVAHDGQGRPFTVRYDEVNAMLLNEFLKEHRKVEEQGSEIAELKAMVSELKADLQEQGVQVRQVNAQLQAKGNPAPRLVSNE